VASSQLQVVWGKKAISLDRQVRLVIGMTIFLGNLAGLFAKGADANASSTMGNVTALMYAAMNGHVSVITVNKVVYFGRRIL